MNMLNPINVNNADIAEAQWHLDNINNNNNVDYININGLQNFIDRAAAVLNTNVVSANVENTLHYLIAQLEVVGDVQTVKERLLVELEYEIGLRGNATQVPVSWVREIVMSLSRVRAHYYFHNENFVNSFLNQVRGFNVNELNYVVQRLNNII